MIYAAIAKLYVSWATILQFNINEYIEGQICERGVHFVKKACTFVRGEGYADSKNCGNHDATPAVPPVNFHNSASNCLITLILVSKSIFWGPGNPLEHNEN